MPYRILKTVGFASLTIYFAVGMYISNHGDDRYPFFSWFLFNTIPNSVDDYSAEIVMYDGTTYNPPVPLADAHMIFNDGTQQSTEYLPRISRLGGSLRNKDVRSEALNRADVEKMFKGKPFTYTVVHLTYDPVEYWKSRAVQSKEVIATYSSRKTI